MAAAETLQVTGMMDDGEEEDEEKEERKREEQNGEVGELTDENEDNIKDIVDIDCNQIIEDIVHFEMEESTEKENIVKQEDHA